MIKNPNPLHPGQVLQEIYLSNLNLNQSKFALLCKCPARKINEIVNCKRSIYRNFVLLLLFSHFFPSFFQCFLEIVRKDAH